MTTQIEEFILNVEESILILAIRILNNLSCRANRITHLEYSN